MRVRPRRVGPRSVTIAQRHVRLEELRAESLRLEMEMSELDSARPRTRGDCEDGPRPCPWVGCRHHLFLDVNPENGTIKLVFPTKDPLELEHSCALDVAEEGEHTLDAIGELLNVTRERTRQIELRASLKVRTSRAVRDIGDGGAFVVDREHHLA